MDDGVAVKNEVSNTYGTKDFADGTYSGSTLMVLPPKRL